MTTSATELEVDPGLVQTVFDLIKSSKCPWREFRWIAKEFTHEDIRSTPHRRRVFKLAYERCNPRKP